MSDERLNSIMGKLTAAGDARKRAQAAAAKREQDTLRSEVETAQLWPIKRSQLVSEVDKLNEEIAHTGMQLHAGDPYFSLPPADRLESYYVGLEPIKFGGGNTAVLQVFVSKSGSINLRVGTKTHLPAKEATVSVADIDPVVWRDWLLSYLEANT